VFQYDKVPANLRTQIVHVCRDAIGIEGTYEYTPDRVWGAIHDVLTREKGLLSLFLLAMDHRNACEQWFLDLASDEDAVDFIEVAARVIEAVLGELDDHTRKMRRIKIGATDAIEEMNYRLRQAGLGFQYENGVLVRMDNRYVHANVVKPALALLGAARFDKANSDFMNAHEHYRAGRYKDCVVACQRAFESALKAICKVQGWEFAQGDRASELISAVRKNGLFPGYLNRSFDTYIARMAEPPHDFDVICQRFVSILLSALSKANGAKLEPGTPIALNPGAGRGAVIVFDVKRRRAARPMQANPGQPCTARLLRQSDAARRDRGARADRSA
jgi:HEPN domain-containing protein